MQSIRFGGTGSVVPEDHTLHPPLSGPETVSHRPAYSSGGGSGSASSRSAGAAGDGGEKVGDQTLTVGGPNSVTIRRPGGPLSLSFSILYPLLPKFIVRDGYFLVSVFPRGRLYL